MKSIKLITVISIIIASFVGFNSFKSNKTIYDFKATTIDGDEKDLSDYKGKVVLIVNVASKCGFTKQYEGLQKIYSDMKDDGFVVLGFPCNQFRNQEPGTEEEIKQFCKTNYGVSFPMFSKVEVNGENTHPLYKFLKSEDPDNKDSDIKWNFEKFLIDKNGKVVKRYRTQVKPSKIADDIKELL